MNSILLKTVFMAVFTLIGLSLLAQPDPDCLDLARWQKSKDKVNYIVGFVPAKARVTNGWAIGWATSIEYHACIDSVQINGLYTNLSPFQVIVAGMGTIMGVVYLCMPSTYKNWPRDTIAYDTIATNHQLNGAGIGLFEVGENFSVQGVQVTALYHDMEKLNGVSVAGIASKYKHFNGVMLSGVYNNAYLGNGVQIGLVNKTTKLNGIQIGLWNQAGNRGLPFINVKLKKKPKTTAVNG